VVVEPKKLGRYLIEAVLGRGAMGVVYLAHDPLIGRRVALKTLRVPADTEGADEFHQRFVREARAVGMLSHPAIVTVHDAGVDEATGLSYIAMELVEGRSLKDLLTSGKGFTYSEVARIGAVIAAALEYAHSKGVIHRDVKPANILVTAEGAVKIMDFGVARLESSDLTTSGQFVGTPNYMSPEQLTGHPIDGRSDLFSLGLVLFELLTGVRPFAGQSFTEMSYKIVHEPAPIPSQVRPGVPPAFNPIVLKLLEKDPERRYGRGDEAARALEALRRVLAGMANAGVQKLTAAAAEAPPPTPAPAASLAPVSEAPSRWRIQIGALRRPIAMRWVALLLLAVIVPPGVLIGMLALRVDRGPWPSPAPDEPERRHRLVLTQRKAAEALAGGRPEEAQALLAEVWDQAPYSAAARALRVAALRELGLQRSSAQRVRLADSLRAEGQELMRTGQYREAQARFTRVLEIAPDDAVAQAYLQLARERQQRRVVSRAAPAEAVAATPAPPVKVIGEARLELYFNSPLSVGEVDLELDGNALAKRPFDFRTKGLFGVKRKGTGIVEDSVKVPAGEHSLRVRLLGADGRLIREEALAARFTPNARHTVRIEMDNENAAPRFLLSGARSR
jgi:tetratricopeptide (TPR) repeat protein